MDTIMSPCQTQVDVIRKQMYKSKTYEEWRTHAIELDHLLGITINNDDDFHNIKEMVHGGLLQRIKSMITS